MYPPYVSKLNWNREKQVNLLIIPDGEIIHFLAETKLGTFLRGIFSKNNGDFCCLSCVHSFREKKQTSVEYKETWKERFL